MQENYNRRKFIKSATAAGLSLGFGLKTTSGLSLDNIVPKGKRVGIIGLDTSHSTAFTKALNSPNAKPEFEGYRVVAAYPKGSNDIESSTKRIPEYTEEVKKYNVKIVDSIKKLLQEVDVVLLETNDGRPHLEQVLPVLKAGKRVFIDKPIAGSLKDTVAIFEAAKQYKVPVFSSSSLRYLASAQEVVQGKIGKVLGADTYSPATLEKTHPDLFWYGIHGVETLFTVMGTGCKSVVRYSTDSTELVVGTWQDNRIGTFRGTRTGTHDYGGTVFGEKGNVALGPYAGYDGLLVQIIKFFQTGQAPVTPEETIEIYAFMESADESKRQGGQSVTLESVLQKARAVKG
ncbi:dehydrogenase [Adhaeribacter arboris]|uniref:Dehydrogenase n=1 Tax=Adhaeribacter arboris TaxID=2072846 RepID=A0A2T2YGQ8_9BACT|nr:Gfo/Idh/MocA family oxidoreductase [Adhaeribacter arboris]PSR54672.1 dehydrogenase [Adhaeribacter arboris]